eukprot:1372-Heterococcus_DN1.PRE.4
MHDTILYARLASSPPLFSSADSCALHTTFADSAGAANKDRTALLCARLSLSAEGCHAVAISSAKGCCAVAISSAKGCYAAAAAYLAHHVEVPQIGCIHCCCIPRSAVPRAAYAAQVLK